MSTKTNTKPVNEVGIIGQMYEDRKTKKVGVLESREPKYKTLMMRDPEGKTFNITYSTFKSNWRKYTGDAVAQTSTQVEEKKVEEKKEEVKKEKSAKKVVEKQTDVVKMTTEEKVKKVHAVDDHVCDMLKDSVLKTTRTSKGCIVVRNKKKTLFEIWIKFNLDKYDFIVSEELVATNRDKFNKVIKSSEYTYKEDWHLKHLCRVSADKFDDIFNLLFDIAKDYISEKETKEEDK